MVLPVNEWFRRSFPRGGGEEVYDELAELRTWADGAGITDFAKRGLTSLRWLYAKAAVAALDGGDDTLAIDGLIAQLGAPVEGGSPGLSGGLGDAFPAITTLDEPDATGPQTANRAMGLDFRIFGYGIRAVGARLRTPSTGSDRQVNLWTGGTKVTDTTVAQVADTWSEGLFEAPIPLNMGSVHTVGYTAVSSESHYLTSLGTFGSTLDSRVGFVVGRILTTTDVNAFPTSLRDSNVGWVDLLLAERAKGVSGDAEPVGAYWDGSLGSFNVRSLAMRVEVTDAIQVSGVAFHELGSTALESRGVVLNEAADAYLGVSEWSTRVLRDSDPFELTEVLSLSPGVYWFGVETSGSSTRSFLRQSTDTPFLGAIQNDGGSNRFRNRTSGTDGSLISGAGTSAATGGARCAIYGWYV